MVKYTVNGRNEVMSRNYYEISGISKNKATKLAIDLCKKFEYVYVSFNDVKNSHGYLNRDGNHQVTGANWNLETE
jgi:hypothetical protein